MPVDGVGMGTGAGRARALSSWPAHFPAWLLAGFAVAWVALGIAPRYRQDWMLENALVLVAIPVLVRLHRRGIVSNGAWLALFVFGMLHEIGAHYTYSEVPYRQWLQVLTGTSPEAWLGAGRNHYDRAIHFGYGLLVAPTALQLIEARAAPRGWWRWLLPVAFIASHSVLYELLEWAAAVVFGGDLGVAYLGTQGDPWDAQQDMLHALAGAAISVTLVLAWRRRRSSRRRARSSGRRSPTGAGRASPPGPRSRTRG